MAADNQQASAIAMNMWRTHIRNPSPQHWNQGCMGAFADWGHFLHTQMSLAQLLPCAACAQSSRLGVGMLQVRPIHVGFVVSCGQAATSILYRVVGFSCFMCGSRVFMLCSSSGKRGFAQVPKPCAIVCNTFGIFPPPYPVVFLVVNHCFTAHLPKYPCGVCNLP